MASATITGPAMPHESKRPLSEEELGKMHAYWRAQHKAVPSIEDRTTRSAPRSKGFCARSFSPAVLGAAEPVILNEETSSSVFESV